MTAKIENLSLHSSLKRLDELRSMMQNARIAMEAICDSAAKNVEDQKALNAMLAENKRKRDELLNPKPVEVKRPTLYIVK